ncbi:hypothetical protein TNCV_595411 [Trichonephila clavipes]|nr:hypothetical protein TNCV_595411 [Trichonephila clavipes]
MQNYAFRLQKIHLLQPGSNKQPWNYDVGMLPLSHRANTVSSTAETPEKGLKRLNLLKRLTATEWGATQDALTIVCKTYVRPVLDYGCEVVTLESTTNLGNLLCRSEQCLQNYNRWSQINPNYCNATPDRHRTF